MIPGTTGNAHIFLEQASRAAVDPRAWYSVPTLVTFYPPTAKSLANSFPVLAETTSLGLHKIRIRKN